MGDRANVKMVSGYEGDTPVFLYTHWCGAGLLKVVHRVLLRRRRWDDCGYLTRMMFCAMVGVCEGSDDSGFGGELGFGISARILDNEHHIIVLETTDGSIWLEDEEGVEKTPHVSFDDFLGTPSLISEKYGGEPV